jgi:hypothetical protein
VKINLTQGATDLSLDLLGESIHDRGGLFIPAHVDRPSFSIYSQLGFIPEDVYDALEITTAEPILETGTYSLIAGSDAHYIDDIGKRYTLLTLNELSFHSIRESLKKSPVTMGFKIENYTPLYVFLLFLFYNSSYMKKIYMYVLLFICVLSLSAQEMVTGEIVYLEGEVNLSRNGEFLPFHEVDMGTIIEEEDMIRTGPDGYAEVELSYPQEGTLLKIQANTAFYFDNRSTGEKNTTSINLLSGTIGLKVSKLAKNQNMNVETQSAVMGIRGTDFDVNMAPTGEILITCEEGKVSCSHSGHGSIFHTRSGL